VGSLPLIWNECVAKSQQVHVQGIAGGEKLTCGPAQLDKMLTEARGVSPWLAEGASVPQQQVIRDFATSRAKALKDIKDRLPQQRRAQMPRWKKKRQARPSLNYTKRGFRLRDGRCTLPAGSC
jgi:putative transposase